MRCKPNDMAFIRKSPLRQNLDKVVEVVRLVGSPLPEHEHLGPLWHVKSRAGIITENGQRVNFAQVPDDWLTPIGGDTDLTGIDETLARKWKRTEPVVTKVPQELRA